MNNNHKTLLAISVTIFGLLLMQFIAKEPIKRFFNFSQKWNAKDYNQYATPQYDIATSVLKEWNFSGNEKILDIGCGDGSISCVMAEKYVPKGSVHAIDLSKDMINFAKSKFQCPNLNFQNLDATNINFKNEFDLVVSFYCIHWIKDQQKLLNGIANSLKDNGKALLYIMTHINKYKLNDVLMSIISSPKWALHFKDTQMPWFFKNEEEFNEIVKKAGLKVINIQEAPQEILFPDKNSLIAWVKAIPMGNHLSPEMRDEFMNDLLQKYFEYVPAEKDGKIKFVLPTLVVAAQKA